MKIGKPTRNELRRARLFCAVLVFVVSTTVISSAQTFTTLLDFDGTNGEIPSALVLGFDGNFYGTTQFEGADGEGTAFKVNANGNLTTLHNFCSEVVRRICMDGIVPQTGLALATNGTFYGRTNNGGILGLGVIFKLTAGGGFTILYNICSLPNCADGESPNQLMQATDGNIYGTALYGGAQFVGTVFKMTPAGTLTTIHSFSGADGDYPQSGLIEGTDGALYGTTAAGGSSTNCNSGCGTVFRLTLSGTPTTLHSFSGADGSDPQGLIQGTDGNLYGVTGAGGMGTSIQCANGCGTVFRITPSGNFTTLHSFCSEANCTDGAFSSTLTEATDGNFYGMTILGGTSTDPRCLEAAGCGTIFEMTPAGNLTTLYNFCSQPSCTDGTGYGAPTTALVQGTDGNLYGTTGEGGIDGGSNYFGPGTIFRLSTGLGPFVKLIRQAGKVGQSGGILGQGFTGTTGVFLNGTPASFTVVSDTYIRATVPAGATSGHITVNTPSGALTSNVVFHVGP